MVCFGLMVIGPYRARYRRREQPTTLREHFLLAVAFALFLVTLTNFSQSTSPFITFWPQINSTGVIVSQSTQAGVFIPRAISSLKDITQLQAIEGYLLEVVLFTGMTLYTIRSFRLTFGFFTFAQLAVAIPMSFMGDHYVVILIGLLAGLLLDAAYYFIRPSLTQPWRFRLFAGISASTLYLVYMLTLLLLGGIAWTIHMTVGSIFVTGMVGWLLSYLILPAQLPQPVEQKG